MSSLRRLWAQRAERPWFVALSLLTVAALLVWPVLEARPWAPNPIGVFRFFDYAIYADAVESWLAGSAIYGADAAGSFHGSYLYPPITVLYFVPFSAFEADVAATLMQGVGLLALWVGLEAVAATLGHRLSLGERLLGLFALFGFAPVFLTFTLAQVPTVLAAALAFAFVAMERDAVDGAAWRGYASGALTTLGASMKVFYAPAGAHLLRSRRRLAGAMATAAVLLAASLALFGVEAHLTYLEVLAWGKGWGVDPPSPTVGNPAYYRPLSVLGALSLPVRALGVLAVIALSLAARGADDARTRRATFALGVAAVPLLAPKANTMDLVVLLVPALVLLAIELDRPGGRPWVPVLAVLLVHVHAAALATLVDPPALLSFAGALPTGLVQPGVWGTLLLVGLAGWHVGAGAAWPAGLRR